MLTVAVLFRIKSTWKIFYLLYKNQTYQILRFYCETHKFSSNPAISILHSFCPAFFPPWAQCSFLLSRWRSISKVRGVLYHIRSSSQKIVFVAFIWLASPLHKILPKYFIQLIWNPLRCFSANIYLFKVNNRNTRKRCEICLKITMQLYWNHTLTDILLVSL